MADKDAYEFVMDFVGTSDSYRRQYIERWREVLANFMVEPVYGTSYTAKSPYQDSRIYRNTRQNVILKDPETHKAVMTYASKIVRSIFGDRERAYIKARPRGWEDATGKSDTVSRLLRYDMGLPGTFRTFVEAVIDMLLFGTSVVELSWHYDEREMPVRTVTQELGVETDEFIRMKVPVYDDPRLTVVDIMDVYPDPTRYRISDMTGFVKRFRMNAYEAKAEGNYDQSSVKKAIDNIGRGSSMIRRESFRSGLDQPQSHTTDNSQFRDMIGYEYWGCVPYETEDSAERRVVTILNNEVVRDIPWPIADPHLPFYTFIINPVQGRFYGISPAEVIRYDQDFADAIKTLLAEAIIRQVHPPIAYDPESEIDPAQILRWQADTLIPARGGPNSVGALRYDANIQGGFAMLQGLQAAMQGASGALGGIQGEPGPDREAASVGTMRISAALDRPELAGMVLENECLPPLGEAYLRRNQQFLDTEGLIQRIGEQPQPIWIGDIMGDFDVEFVGSRMEMSKQETLQSYDRLVSLSAAIPPLMMAIPWTEVGKHLIGDVMQLPEVAAMIGNPQDMIANLLMQQAAGGGNAGAPRSSEPAGMQAAQAGGGALGPA